MKIVIFLQELKKSQFCDQSKDYFADQAQIHEYEYYVLQHCK